jgi:hypothetical protein
LSKMQRIRMAASGGEILLIGERRNIMERACCLNCVKNRPYIYCEYFIMLISEGKAFDETGETQACINYKYNNLTTNRKGE